MNFKEIIGHDLPVGILKRAIAHGTLAHAYIFAGEGGIGKKTVALTLAAAVNCSAPSDDGGCGRCPSCAKMRSLSHPDIHIISPDGDEIKIDQVRDVQAELALKPFEGKKKILIVDDADRMNVAAANAFLKTLEEPPGDSIIILVTAAPGSLLPTIHSRCQKISFNPLPRRVLADVLMKKRGVGEDEAVFLAALARGSIGRALSMDVEAEKAERGEVLQLIAGAAGMSGGAIVAYAERWHKNREKFERFIEMGIEWLRDVLVYKETRDEGLVINKHFRDTIDRWARATPRERLLSDIELFEASRSMIEHRVSEQLVAENLLFWLGENRGALK